MVWMTTSPPTAIAPRLEGTVNLDVGVHDGVQGAAPDESLHANVGWHGAYRLASLSDDGMHPNAVLVPEGLAVVVNGAEGQGRSIERIDAQVGRSACVGPFTDELYLLRQGAVVGPADAQLPLIRVGGRMAHHGEINVIELAQPHHFRFPSQELQFACTSQGVAVLNLDIFLGGHRYERQTSAQVL